MLRTTAMLVLAGWLLSGATATAQTENIQNLLEQVLQLKKQVALEKARADAQAAQAEAARQAAEDARREALAQREQALKAEAVARVEAERAAAALREALRQPQPLQPQPPPRPQPPQPRQPVIVQPEPIRPPVTEAALEQALAVLARAQALLQDEEVRLAEIAARFVPGTLPVRAQEERVAAARQNVAEAQARADDIRKRLAANQQTNEVERLQRELEATRAQAEKALAQAREREQAALAQARDRERAAQAEALVLNRKLQELLERSDTDRKELAKKLEQETVRAQAERDRAVAAEVEKKALLDRVKALEQRIAELEKALQGKPGEQPRNPGSAAPKEKIEGAVAKVEGGLMVVNVGADAGLQKGQTLELFRLAPQPKYLGKVEVVDVRPKEAVVRPVGKLTSDAQAGDKVATKFE